MMAHTKFKNHLESYWNALDFLNVIEAVYKVPDDELLPMRTVIIEQLQAKNYDVTDPGNVKQRFLEVHRNVGEFAEDFALIDLEAKCHDCHKIVRGHLMWDGQLMCDGCCNYKAAKETQPERDEGKWDGAFARAARLRESHRKGHA